MNGLRHRCPAVLLCLFLTIVVGCNSGDQASNEHDDHGHSHHHADTPETLQAAITKLQDMWVKISTAMENDDPDGAHTPLHDVGHVLDAIPDLAAETDLPEDQWKEVKAEVEKLFVAFGDIDTEFHKEDGDKVAAYESAKSTIDEGVAALEAKLALLDEGSSTDDHSSDDHDDDDAAAEG